MQYGSMHGAGVSLCPQSCRYPRNCTHSFRCTRRRKEGTDVCTIPHLCKVGSSNCWELDSEFLVFMGSIRSVMMVGMHLPAYVWVLRLKLPRKWDILSKAWKTAKSDLSNKLAQYQNIITILDKTWFEYWKYNKLGYESQFSQNCIHILCPCLG